MALACAAFTRIQSVHYLIRCGDIGDNPREVEYEPLTAPSVPEPITVPAPAPVAPEPVKEPVHV